MLAGFAGGVITWLVAASKLEGELTVSTLSADDPVLAGNVVSILLPTIICCVWTYLAPDNYDWAVSTSAQISLASSSLTRHSSPSLQATRAINASATPTSTESASPEKAGSLAEGADSPGLEEKAQVSDLQYEHLRAAGVDPVELQKSFRSATLTAIPLTFILLIFVPCMAIIKPVWGTAGLTAWIAIAIGWLFISFGAVGLLPLWESRASLAKIFSGIAKDLTGGNGKVERIN